MVLSLLHGNHLVKSRIELLLHGFSIEMVDLFLWRADCKANLLVLNRLVSTMVCFGEWFGQVLLQLCIQVALPIVASLVIVNWSLALFSLLLEGLGLDEM